MIYPPISTIKRFRPLNGLNGFKKGYTPWHTGLKGVKLPNSGSWKKGEHSSPTTEFKKGYTPWNKGTKQSPETINKSTRALLKVVCKHPNSFEVNALNYLNSIYHNKFTYTGDGTFIVNNRSADAYSEELKTVALFNGCYWHLKRFGFKVDDKAKGAVELIESVRFLEAGYKVIFIWEDELNAIIST